MHLADQRCYMCRLDCIRLQSRGFHSRQSMDNTHQTALILFDQSVLIFRPPSCKYVSALPTPIPLAAQMESHPQCILQFRPETSHNANYKLPNRCGHVWLGLAGRRRKPFEEDGNSFQRSRLGRSTGTTGPGGVAMSCFHQENSETCAPLLSAFSGSLAEAVQTPTGLPVTSARPVSFQPALFHLPHSLLHQSSHRCYSTSRCDR